jgi:undecaprenyl-diphosphatase
MFEYLHAIDVALFRFFNTSISNPYFDFIMPFLTDLNKQRLVLVLVVAILLWIMIRGSTTLRLTTLVLIITIIVSDQFSSSIIKYWLLRPRPCRSLENVRLLVSCGSGYSFPSTHAVNNFAGALVIAFFFPRVKWWFFGFAALIAFSRIYVGVHYPSDVIGGAILGLLCGGCVILLFVGLEKLLFFLKHSSQQRKK